MRELLKIACKLLIWAVIVAAVVIVAAMLHQAEILSAKSAFALILSIPFWSCLYKTLSSVWLMKYGLPATGYFSVQTRLAHLRYVSADGVEHKGSCDLLTRRMLKKGDIVPIWYHPKRTERFTAGGREILIHLMFCVLFVSIPLITLILL